jgi:dihydroorotate dehydrogenase electron transfer subunit
MSPQGRPAVGTVAPTEGCGERRAPFEGAAPVRTAEVLVPGLCRLSLEAPEIARIVEPGQFLLVRPDFAPEGGTDPLLGRPLAVADADPASGTVELLVQPFGRGTRRIAAARPGDSLFLRGPLGSPLPEPVGRRVFLLGGGAGIAPFFLAARRMMASGRAFRFVPGLPDASWAPFAAELEARFPGSLRVVSEDGSLGERGNPIGACLREATREDEAWVCGPPGMTAAAMRDLRGRLVRLLLSLEVRMACGVGGCLGCVVSTLRGRLRSCVEGPFFDASEVVPDEE